MEWAPPLFADWFYRSSVWHIRCRRGEESIPLPYASCTVAHEGEHHRHALGVSYRTPSLAGKIKNIFPVTVLPSDRASPTTGSDRGSLRDHDLTLIVGLTELQRNLHFQAN